MTSEAVESKTPEDKTETARTENETTEQTNGLANGESRFSNDDMDTEIEVTPDENTEAKPKRKKKRKSKTREGAEGGDEPRETSEERRERRRKKKERKAAKAAKLEESSRDQPSPPPYEEGVDAERSQEPMGKKQELKKKMSNLLDAPLLLCAGIFVCVLLPFSIYACDVILSVNIIDAEAYKFAIIDDKNDFTLLPSPEKLTGKKYTIHDTIFMTIQINSRAKKRTSRDAPEVVEAAAEATTTTDVSSTTSTKPFVTTDSTTSSSTTTITTPATSPVATQSPPNTTIGIVNVTTSTLEINSTAIPSNSTLNSTAVSRKKTRKPSKFRPPPVSRGPTTTTVSTVPANTTVMDPEPYKQQEGEYCKGIYYFYELHHSYSLDHGSDWMNDQTSSVYQKEQALFFMFTVFGFLFLLASLALRCDIFLSEEWSSFLLVNFLLYSISMAITASVFGQESSSGGLRCATCRFTVNCTDIDPWDIENHWPANPANDRWNLVALLSFIFKLVDCYTIAIVTLKFIIDINRDLWWATCIKIIGWLLVFPILIFTPMLGVIRYQALPGVSPDDYTSMTAVAVFFYIGIAFWALCLAALPFFCRSRMCSKSDDHWEEDEGEEY